MEIEKIKAIIEAILFAAGRQVTIKELMISLEMPKEDLENIIVSMQEDYKIQNRGIEIISGRKGGYENYKDFGTKLIKDIELIEEEK